MYFFQIQILCFETYREQQRFTYIYTLAKIYIYLIMGVLKFSLACIFLKRVAMYEQVKYIIQKYASMTLVCNCTMVVDQHHFYVVNFFLKLKDDIFCTATV